MKYVQDGKGWIDPFAGINSPAEITNDLDPTLETTYSLDALEFLKMFSTNSQSGVLFDPPYSYAKAARLYKQKYTDSQVFFNYIRQCKRELCRIVKQNGMVIMCGWSSNGLGIKNGFEIIEILLVPHGWNKIDTIVTVERKIQHTLDTKERAP